MKRQIALVVIDMQHDFVTIAPPEFTSELVPRIAKRLESARALKVPVAHVITEYHEDKSDWPKAFADRDHLRCIRGTKGAEIMEALSPLPGEAVLAKTRYSAFYETKLEAWLESNTIQGIALCGYAIDVCVRLTAIDAYNRGYSITLLSDCLLPERATLTDSIEYLTWLTRCDVKTGQEWLGLLSG
jgi:nicotinamidase-related amidase